MINIIKEKSSNVKIKISQKINLDFELEDEDAPIGESEIIEQIDFNEESTAIELKRYMKEYNEEDKYKEVYNSVERVELDCDFNALNVYITLGMNFSDEKLKYVFEDFIKEVVLEDDQFRGMIDVPVEPYESEPYEIGYDGYHEKILYGTTTIDEVSVDYSTETIGDQTIEITR